MKKRKARKRTQWVGKVVYPNGYFRSGIVKNNIPKHDVIRIGWLKETKNNKNSTEIDSGDWELTVDEAMAVVFLLSKAILFYIFKSEQDIRLWEYQDKLKKVRIIKKAKK